MSLSSREVDLVVTKKIPSGPQIPLLVVEIKREDLDLYKALEQIEDYMKRVVTRRVTLGHLEMPVLGLLVLGASSVRMGTEKPKKSDTLIGTGTARGILYLSKLILQK